MLRYIGFIVLFYVSELVADDLLVDLGKIGKVQGKLIDREGFKVRAFLGIPYAQPPVSNLRFKPPRPLYQFPGNGTYSGRTYASPCMALDNIIADEERDGTKAYSAHGDEDCLYLNIFTPRTAGPLQVWVNFHDGAFSFGTAREHDYLKMVQTQRALVVQVAYRLGPFGFLSTGDTSAPGNMGLKDQVMALKWIKANIAKFNGDPTRVILAGTGAGGASAHLHVLSQASKGLFSAAYCSSGNALMPHVVMGDIPQKTKRLAAMLGCPTSSSAIIVDCLRFIPAHSIAGALSEFKVFMYSPFTIFGPTVEAQGSEDIFLAMHPRKVYQERKHNDVPLLIGSAIQGGLYNAAEYINRPRLLKMIDENWQEYLPHMMFYNATVIEKEGLYIAYKLKETFMGSKPLSPETKNQFLQMLSERLYMIPTLEAAGLHVLQSQKGAYLYRFSYPGPSSTALKITKDAGLGVSAGDDFAYAFPMEGLFAQGTPDDHLVSKKMINLLIGFGQEGYPPQELFWPEFAPDEGPFMDIENAKFQRTKEFVPYTPNLSKLREIFHQEQFKIMK